MKISISGDLGSGKSTVGRALSTMLGYEYFSTGQIHRRIAAELGMDTLELNQAAESQSGIDARVDAFLIELNASPHSMIIDSRLAWHFIPSSLKVYLTADPAIAADRILRDSKRIGEKYRSVELAREQLRLRRESEDRRFTELHGVVCGDLRNYDCVLDTTYLSPDQVTSMLLSLIAAKASNH